MTRTVAGLALHERAEEHGRVRLVLVDDIDGLLVDACRLTIDRLELRDGAGGLVRVDGIGNVATVETHRGRGLASDLLEVAIERMREGDAAGSLLYGIDGFYDPFGWRSCGDERWVAFPAVPGRADHLVSPAHSIAEARPMLASDLPELARVYEQIAARVPGAARRDDGSRTWSLLDPAQVMVVIRSGELAGWAWRGDTLAAHGSIRTDMPGMNAFVELQAVDVDAAWHVLQAAREMADQVGDAPRPAWLVTGAPDAHPLRELARSQWLDAQLVDTVRPHGGAMLLPFSGDAARVATDTYQFIPDRF